MKDSKLERSLNDLVDSLVAKIEQLEDKNTELEEEVDSLNKENDDLVNDMARKDEEIEELKSEIKNLGEPLDFGSNIKEVKRNSPNYNLY